MEMITCDQHAFINWGLLFGVHTLECKAQSVEYLEEYFGYLALDSGYMN
jgi:hypothetical protein